MSISAVLGTAIGLILVFALLALFCSGVTEMISNLLQMRARYLLTGLRSILDQHEASPVSDRAGRRDKNELFDKIRTLDAPREAAARIAATVPSQVGAPSGADAGGGPGVAVPADGAAVPGVAEPDAVAPPNPARNDLTLALFNHPLLRSLQTRRIRWPIWRPAGGVRNPQYISPQVFVRAVIGTLVPDAVPARPPGIATGPSPTDPNVLERLRAAVVALPDTFPARAGLLALIVQAEGDLQRFEASLETWYDEEMARIAGWYKRWAKVMLGVAGFAVAVLVNVDVVQVGHGLYVDEPVRTAVVAAAQNGTLCQDKTTTQDRAACADQQLSTLDAAGLPIWYPPRCRPMSGHPAACWAWSPNARLHWWDSPLKILGWVLTAFAVSFGAPFWFDALSKLGSLRNTGPKPAP